MTIDEAEDDKPLDPKVEAIRRKMVRLLMVSGGIMMIGLMTVLAAIVYKVNTSVSKSVVQDESTISVPADAKIISTAMGDGRVMLTLQTRDGSRELRIFDRNGNLLNTLKIQQE